MRTYGVRCFRQHVTSSLPRFLPTLYIGLSWRDSLPPPQTTTVARRIPFDDPEILTYVRIGYVAVQLIVLVTYYYVSTRVRTLSSSPCFRFFPILPYPIPTRPAHEPGSLLPPPSSDPTQKDRAHATTL